MKNNVIYGYKKKSSNKIVYVGQTQNLEYRHRQHVQYDPYNENNPEYNYPLSRGIRKYGPEEYELVILEEVDNKEQLNEREIWWIKHYNTYFDGYNQSLGGVNPVIPIFNQDKIDLIICMLKNLEYSFQDICDATGVSMTQVYNINTGKRRSQEGIEYPIRPNNAKGTQGLKFDQEQNRQIHEILLHSPKTISQIARDFNCTRTTIERICKGKTKRYVLPEYTYPLR